MLSLGGKVEPILPTEAIGKDKIQTPQQAVARVSVGAVVSMLLLYVASRLHTQRLRVVCGGL